MKIQAHCFAENASISPNSFKFKFKDYDIHLFSIEEKLTLQLTKIASSQDIENLRRDKDVDLFGKDLESKMLPYKVALTEVAQLLEGLFSIMYVSIPPKFNTNRINVNLYSETEEEQKILDNDIVPRFFGNVSMPKKKPSYQINSALINLINPSISHIPAFSFFSQATRSLENNDNEISFFLYFRIIDGYFSEGASAVETELLKKVDELKKYLPYEDNLKSSTNIILTELGLTSKSHLNYEGLISDIVLIRHKLTHFSSTKAKRHHSAKMTFELFTLNSYLHQACFNLLREKVYENPQND